MISWDVLVEWSRGGGTEREIVTINAATRVEAHHAALQVLAENYEPGGRIVRVDQVSWGGVAIWSMWDAK